MARGTALLFGFRLINNFDHPYLARNFGEFWKKWHISLSSWLRDYLYIPLGGSRTGKTRTAINLSLTMLLGGLWHGASWNFVLWGALHGLYLVCSHFFPAKFRIKIPVFLQVGLTFTIVSLTWIFFRSPNFATTKEVFSALHHVSWSGLHFPIATLFLVSLMLLVDLPQVLRKAETAVLAWAKWQQFAYTFAMISLTLMSGDINGSVFIYFQF